MLRRRRWLAGARALDLVLGTRRERPWLGDPELARLVIERAIEEPETLAVGVLPDRVLWLLDDWREVERILRMFRLQAGQYAEIYGAPVGRVWQRGFWYRPLGEEEVLERARQIVRAAEEAGLRSCQADWPAGLSSLVDEEGRVLQWTLRSTRREPLREERHGPEHPQRRDRSAGRGGG